VVERLGACHCIDIPFVFDLLDAPQVARPAGPNPPQSLATWLHRTMVDFVKTGDPGLPGYDVQHRRVTLIDREPWCADDPFSAESAFWCTSALALSPVF
jgi:para-nitrobenzyl esterase